MHADVEIAADVILLAKRRPPDVTDPLRVGNPLCRRIAAEPVEVEVHRVVNDVVLLAIAAKNQWLIWNHANFADHGIGGQRKLGEDRIDLRRRLVV